MLESMRSLFSAKNNSNLRNVFIFVRKIDIDNKFKKHSTYRKNVFLGYQGPVYVYHYFKTLIFLLEFYCKCFKSNLED